MGCAANGERIYLSPHAALEFNRMRLLSATLAIAMLASPMADAAKSTRSAKAAPPNPCTYEGDRVAFDIEGLKSELMVTALVCKQQDRYNDFMGRYRPNLVS